VAPPRELVQAALGALAATAGTSPGETVWRELADSAPLLLRAQDGPVGAALAAILVRLGSLPANHPALEGTARLLQSLAHCVTPANAPTLFELVVRTVTLSPGGSAGSVLHAGSFDGGAAAARALADDTLAAVAATLPRPPALPLFLDTPPAAVLPVAPEALAFALAQGGVAVRCRLAALVPLCLLADANMEVREAAVAELAARVAHQAAHLAGGGAPAGTAMSFGGAVALLRACRPDRDDSDAILLRALAAAPSAAAAADAAATSVCSHVVVQGSAAGRALAGRVAAASLAVPAEDMTFAEASLLRVAAPLLAHAVGAGVAAVLASAHNLAAVGEGEAAAGRLAVGLVAAGVGRLIRAAAATAESDPRGAPDAGVVAALDTVVASVPPRIVHAFALSEQGLRRLRVLVSVLVARVPGGRGRRTRHPEYYPTACPHSHSLPRAG
jgi:hypothetical protein